MINRKWAKLSQEKIIEKHMDAIMEKVQISNEGMYLLFPDVMTTNNTTKPMFMDLAQVKLDYPGEASSKYHISRIIKYSLYECNFARVFLIIVNGQDLRIIHFAQGHDPEILFKEFNEQLFA